MTNVKSALFLCTLFLTTSLNAGDNWPMAGGPDGTWKVEGPEPPLKFSVRTHRNIVWKTTLPEGGQSGIAVHNDLAFLTIMKPWEPQDNPDLLAVHKEDAEADKLVQQESIDKALIRNNPAFQTLRTTFINNEKQIEQYIVNRVQMLLEEDSSQNVQKLRERVRRFHPKVKELEIEQRRVTNQMDKIRAEHSQQYQRILNLLAELNQKIRNLPSLKGTDIVAYCLNANTGDILWSVPLKGSVEGPYNYGFSDSSSPTPITDGKHVWFVNASGSMGCWTVRGKLIWFREWTPSAKAPFNKQFEPILTGEWILNVEPLPESDPRKAKEGERKWNYLRAINKRTGKTDWIAEDAITHYNTPILGQLNNKPFILQGRGGPHEVPERPNGLSLTHVAGPKAGKAVWHWDPQEEIPFGALANQHWDSQYAYWLKTGQLKLAVLNAQTGKQIHEHDLFSQATTTLWNKEVNGYETQVKESIGGVIDLRHTNIVAGGHFYFLVRDKWQVARVNIESGKTEFLELPSQVDAPLRGAEKWTFGEVQPNDTRNSRGFDVAQDPRIKLGGFTKSFLGAPTVVNDRIYFTSMTGLVYILDANAEALDADAILAVNDLGPIGQTWTVNSVSYANGRLYHRTMKEVICIGTISP